MSFSSVDVKLILKRPHTIIDQLPDETEQNIAFVRGEQIDLPKDKAEANNWSARHWQMTIFCDNRVQLIIVLYLDLNTKFVFIFKSLWQFREVTLLFLTQERGYNYAWAENNLQQSSVSWPVLRSLFRPGQGTHQNFLLGKLVDITSDNFVASLSKLVSSRTRDSSGTFLLGKFVGHRAQCPVR